MENLKNLISNTKRVHPKIIENATEVNIFDIKIKSIQKKDVETLVFVASAHALTDGKNVFWNVIIELYPNQKHLNLYQLPDLATPCFVSCSCPYFTYFCEYAVTKAGSSSIEYSNGKRPVVRNKNSVPIICKHLIASSKFVVPAIQKWAKTKEKRVKFA